MYFSPIIVSALTIFSTAGSAMASDPHKIELSAKQLSSINAIKAKKEEEPADPNALVSLNYANDKQDLHITPKAVDGETTEALVAPAFEIHQGISIVPLDTQDIKVKKQPEDSDRRLRGGRKAGVVDHKTQQAFAADVAMPIQFQVKESRDSNRRLQTAQCFEQPDGLLACVVGGFPGDDFATVFLNCPVTAMTVLDCSSCTIVVTNDDTPNEIDLANDPQCSSCSVCSDTVAYDCSNLATGACVLRDCDGECSSADSPTPSPPTPAPTPPPTTDETSGPMCAAADDGSLTCRLEDFPADGFNARFSSCPSSATSLFECASCAIGTTGGLCSSCTVCADNVAWDCSNVASGGCAVRDCDGNCFSGR